MNVIQAGGIVPDVLVMTATPIPRTAAMTVSTASSPSFLAALSMPVAEPRTPEPT